MQKFVCDFIHAMFEAKFQKFAAIKTFSIFNLFGEKSKQKCFKFQVSGFRLEILLFNLKLET